MLEFKTPKIMDLYEVAGWRNSVPESLRTHGETTEKQQDRFYNSVICQEDSPHKYFSVYDDEFNQLIGLVGLTDIDHVNGNAEISLIISPEFKRMGYGKLIVRMILTYAFKTLRLENVYGECYYCNPNIEFWNKVCTHYSANVSRLAQRKYWDGIFWDSLYFTINKKGLK